MKSITIYSRAPGTPGQIQRPYPSDPVAARARRDAEMKARIAQRSAETEAWIASMMARVNAPWAPVGSGGSEEGRRARAERLELQRLADLRRRGFPPSALKQMMDTLRDCFRRRLSETLDDAGEMRLLTDGTGLFLRTRHGHIFDLLVDPTQPLITMLGTDPS